MQGKGPILSIYFQTILYLKYIISTIPIYAFYLQSKH